MFDERELNCQTGSCPNPADGDVSNNVGCGAVGCVGVGCGNVAWFRQGRPGGEPSEERSASARAAPRTLSATSGRERFSRQVLPNVQCLSVDTALAGGIAAEQLRGRVHLAQDGCSYFTFGKGSAAGECHMEGAADDTCSDGTTASTDYDYYKTKQNVWTQKCTTHLR